MIATATRILLVTGIAHGQMTCDNLQDIYQQASLIGGGNGCCENPDSKLNIPECNVLKDVSHLVRHTRVPPYFADVLVDDPTYGKYVPAATFAHHASPTVLQSVLHSASTLTYPLLIFNKVRLCLYTNLGIVADMATGKMIGWRENDQAAIERFEDRKYMSKYVHDSNATCNSETGICTGGAVTGFSVGYVDVKETDRLSNVTLTSSVYMKGKRLNADGTWFDDESHSTWVSEWRLAACSSSRYSDYHKEWSFKCGFNSIEVIVFDKHGNTVPSLSYQQSSFSRFLLTPLDLAFYRPVLSQIPENIRNALGININEGIIDSTYLLSHTSYPNDDGVYFNQLVEMSKIALTNLNVPESSIQQLLPILGGLSQAAPMVDCVYKEYLSLDALTYKLFTDAYPR